MVGSGGDSGHVGSDVAPIPTDEDTDKSWESIILPKLVLYSFSVATLITFSRAISEAAHAEYGRTTISCFISFVLTIGGMLVFGFLVGILTDIIGAFFEELKKGRSRVLESGHTLILNWSNKLLPLLAEVHIELLPVLSGCLSISKSYFSCARPTQASTGA
eukprot:1097527-Amorphochlora_amoeboformis.AAC.2